MNGVGVTNEENLILDVAFNASIMKKAGFLIFRDDYDTYTGKIYVNYKK